MGEPMWRPMTEAPTGEVIWCRDADKWVQPMIVERYPATVKAGRWPWSKETVKPGYSTYCFALPTDRGDCFALAMRADMRWTPVEWCWPHFEDDAP